MCSAIFQPNSEKNLVKKPVVISTTAEKLKTPEYSVDKTAKKPLENPAPVPRKLKP